MELSQIGVVESPLTDPAAAPKQGREGAPEAVLVIAPEVAEGLDGIAPRRRGDRAHLARPRGPRRAARPPARRPSNPERGVFSTRSADRPNPIGLHVVEVVAIDGARLRVRHLEAVDGTPVLDLKPVI
jgi:tRNA-Thr(GGU) m(6)t(6)A37 methyltransferase TsaA